MAGLDPAIHQASVGERRGVFSARKARRLDGRLKGGHDEFWMEASVHL
jgi:hypothetical protein